MHGAIVIADMNVIGRGPREMDRTIEVNDTLVDVRTMADGMPYLLTVACRDAVDADVVRARLEEVTHAKLASVIRRIGAPDVSGQGNTGDIFRSVPRGSDLVLEMLDG